MHSESIANSNIADNCSFSISIEVKALDIVFGDVTPKYVAQIEMIVDRNSSC